MLYHLHNVLRFHGAGCGKALRPEILHPEYDGRRLDFFHNDRWQPHGNRRRFIDKNDVIWIATFERSQNTCKKSKRKIVQRQAKSTAFSSRQERHTDDFHSEVILRSFPDEAVSRKKFTARIV